VLENISQIIKLGGFIGSCSLTKDMVGHQIYRRLCEQAWEGNRKSHIHTRIIPAIEGEFGDYRAYGEVEANVTGSSESDLFVNPLMGIYWFFDLGTVVRQNQYIDTLRPSKTLIDAKTLFRNNLVYPARIKKALPI
jgi:hypothetical protein